MRLGDAGRYVLAGSVGAALCVVAVFFATNTSPPAALDSPAQVAETPITPQAFADPRPVDVLVESGPDIALRAGREGLVTGIECVAGGQWSSGTSSLSIDGRALLSLHTTVPLWRELVVGATGPDVTALKAELSRLQRETSEGDRLRGTDIRALRAVASGAGVDDDFDAILPSDIVWLPAPAITTQSCTVTTGDRLSLDTELATAQSSVTVHVQHDGELLPGDRQLEIGGLMIPLAGDLTLFDPAQAAEIIKTAAYQASKANAPADNGGVKIGGVVALTNPVQVSAVPPGSVRAESLTAGCVNTELGVLPVTIVSSELGSTFVLFSESEAPGSVSTTAPSSCG